MKVLASPAFIRQFNDFCQVRPLLREKLRAFLAFRTEHQSGEPFNTKDAAFRGNGGQYAGFRHCHLVIGRAIVTYSVKPGEIKLYCLTDHAALDSGFLAHYLSNTEFVPFALGDPEPEKLDDKDIEKVKAEVYDLAGSGDPAFLAATRGDVNELLEWLEAVVDRPDGRSLILDAFGGESGFLTFLKDTKKHFGIKEGMRYWMNLLRS